MMVRFLCKMLKASLCLSAVLPLQMPAAGENPFTCYEVPPMSSVKRLPDSLPSDAVRTDCLRVIAAKGEYEPVSFVVVPHRSVDRFELKISDLKNGKNTIPSSAVDAKVVKCWYQAGTAWYSYFADGNRRELVPELLLNDETLIRVDREKKENFLRVDGKYEWISYPKSEAKEAFNYLTAKVSDGRTLQPVTLTKNENKQFWLTVKVPKDIPDGIYNGTVGLFADGKKAGELALSVKVLPFELPMPKTYYDLTKPYLVTIYGSGIYDLGYRLGMERETLDFLQMKIYEDLLAHNVFNCRSDLTLARQKDRKLAVERLKHELEMLKKAGFVTKPLLSLGWSFPLGNYAKAEVDQEFKNRIDELAQIFQEVLGHHDVYITSWDEAPESFMVTMRKFSEYSASKGLKLWVTTHKGRQFNRAGYVIDYANHGGHMDPEEVAAWHSIGAKVSSYAGPHTGPENPDVFRRLEGLARYKKNYDGSYNYKLYSQLHPTLYKRQKSNVWNDFMDNEFRGFNLIYPTAGGPIDTLAWEGYREGIDDVRYATLLKQLADEAMAGDNYKAALVAKKALIWLWLMDADTADLNSVRLEMIDHIMKIRKAMGK